MIRCSVVPGLWQSHQHLWGRLCSISPALCVKWPGQIRCRFGRSSPRHIPDRGPGAVTA